MSRKGQVSMAAAGIALVAFLTSSMCSTSSTPKTAPPERKVLQMPGFRLAPPPGEGWQGLAERSIRTASFWKKWGGYLRFITDEQRRADLSVTAIMVPLGYWSTTGDELTALLKGEYAMDLGFGVATAWETVEYAGRTVHCLRSAGALNESAGFRGVEAYDEEMGIWESNLPGLFFPSDLESSHRYFEIYVRITSIDSAVRFHKDPERGLFEALVRGLEVDGPFADIRGPGGSFLASRPGSILASAEDAGVMKEGCIYYPEEGTPQGGVISPLLANVYLNEVIDQWFAHVVKRRLRGRAHRARYASDLVMLFEKKIAAKRLSRALRQFKD